MSISNTRIQLKKSGVSGNTPTSLNFGELALNYADGKLYYKDDSGNTSFIKNSNSFSTIVANSYSLVAGTNTDVLNLESANGSYGIDITANTQSKTITIADSDTQTLIGKVNDYVGSAYNKANNLAIHIDSIGEVSNTYYINFADRNRDSSNILYATANNTLTFTGTDGSSVAFGAGGTVLYSGSTIPSGTVWNGNVIGAIYGGTGVANNAASTIAISGAYGTTFTVSGTTALTLPTSGTVTALGNSTTGTGNIVLAGAPTIAGGAHTGITNLAVRDTSAAYDVTIAAVSSTTLTAGRTLTIDVVNAARTLKFGGNLTLGANFTTDTNAISFATSGATSVTLPTSGTLATTGNLSQFAATTSAQLAGVISDETGSGALVFGTSPTFTTSIDAGATFTAFATPTTVTGFAAATSLTIGGTASAQTISIGASSTSASTYNFGTGATSTGNTKTVNLGTAGATGSTTNVNIGSASGGTTTVNNDLTVTGNLDVKGSVSFIESTTVQVADKNLELGKVVTPTDTTADGGGITLKGATDKTIIWDSANANWTSSENWNLVTGKTFKINNVTVLSSTQILGKTIGGTTPGDIVTINGVQTLTYKTFDTAGAGNSFKINGTAITAVTGTGAVVLQNSPSLTTPTIGPSGAYFSAVSSGTIALNTVDTAGTYTVSLPAATDTLVGKATTDTLTNKTLSSAVITGTVTAGGNVGTAGYVLSSTGTGVQWVAQSGGGSGGGLSVDESIIYSMIF
jgi:hypothetical protein